MPWAGKKFAPTIVRCILHKEKLIEYSQGEFAERECPECNKLFSHYKLQFRVGNDLVMDFFRVGRN